MSQEKLNPKDIYAINIKDPDKYADVENKAGVYAAIIVMTLLGSGAIIRSCGWYVVLAFMVQVVCCIPMVMSFVMFMLNKDRFMASIYDITYGNIDLYARMMLIGGVVNLVVCIATSFIFRFSLEAIIIGLLSLIIIVFSRLSLSYVKGITWRIRHYLKKKTNEQEVSE